MIPYLALRKLCKAAGKQEVSSCHVKTLHLARRVADRTQRTMLYQSSRNRCRVAVDRTESPINRSASRLTISSLVRDTPEASLASRWASVEQATGRIPPLCRLPARGALDEFVVIFCIPF